jgi:hypothetical protein
MVEKEQAVDVHLAVVAAATAAVSFVPKNTRFYMLRFSNL